MKHKWYNKILEKKISKFMEHNLREMNQIGKSRKKDGDNSLLMKFSPDNDTGYKDLRGGGKPPDWSTCGCSADSLHTLDSTPQGWTVGAGNPLHTPQDYTALPHPAQTEWWYIKDGKKKIK